MSISVRRHLHSVNSRIDARLIRRIAALEQWRSSSWASDPHRHFVPWMSAKGNSTAIRPIAPQDDLQHPIMHVEPGHTELQRPHDIDPPVRFREIGFWQGNFAVERNFKKQWLGAVIGDLAQAEEIDRSSHSA